jgi:hypothetical protein
MLKANIDKCHRINPRKSAVSVVTRVLFGNQYSFVFNPLQGCYDYWCFSPPVSLRVIIVEALRACENFEFHLMTT